MVLRVQPLEVESELPFAGLSDLVRPIVHLLERIPQPQAEALAGAVALGPRSSRRSVRRGRCDVEPASDSRNGTRPCSRL